ncbi:MAG TPA: hypothetical protein VMC83_02790 [Streptosporangiaceae bacterium]|nr:hypothetical protein [Streptosporangiaceae bacterium]
MRSRTSLGVLICCCAALAACTAGPPKGLDATVTTPAVGRPPAPASEGAALGSEAFTPYADLGAAANDGLAPGDTYANLHTACMQDAGYGQYAASTPFNVRANRGMGFPQPYGPWGYIGLQLAEQYGFNAPETDIPVEGGGAPGSAASMPAQAQAAAGKCLNIVQDFNNAQFATSTAGIETMNDDISDDVVNDPDLRKAQHAWTACMARNGYDGVQANTIWQQYVIGFGPGPSPASSPSPTSAQNEAQIAAAVTDADCTLSTDLGGIYFAIQDSYERQFVTANQQALNVAVREFKANYAKELSRLPALLRTASATPNLPVPRPSHSAH